MNFMSRRPEELHRTRLVKYDTTRWKQLENLRKRTLDVISDLYSSGIDSYVYGSVARGDVSTTSDIDIIIPYPVSSFKVELAIGKGTHREAVQATPSSVVKGHIYLRQNTVVTFPLFKMLSRERDFYKWGGMVNTTQLEKDTRVPGVDKRLLFIEPTDSGHRESGVIGHEHEVAKKLDVSVEIAKERVRVLTRRSNVGRTGVYLTRQLNMDESFEEVLKNLRDRNPAIRRTIENRLE